jgi:hypothetical protein
MHASPFNNLAAPTKGRSQSLCGGNVSRPRAADDFATIAARLAELRRERELAARRAPAGADDPTSDGSRPSRGDEGRPRLDRGELPGLGVGRRYLPVRQR